MERIKWYRVEVDRQAMKALQVRSDVHGLMQAGSQLLVVCLTGWLCYYAFHNWSVSLVLATFFLHGTFFAFLSPAAACHELSHGTPFKTKSLNEFFYNLFSFLTWSNPVTFRISHIEHHQFTLHDDADQEVILPTEFGALDWIKAFTLNVPGAQRGIWIHNIIWRHLLNAFGLLNTEWEKHLFEDKPKKKKQMVLWAQVMVFGHLVLAALFIYISQWILIPIMLLPFYATWLSVLVGVPQHAGLQDNVPDFRRSCRTMKLSPFTRWCYWNMNYHIEHHMFAAVPFYQLGRLNKLLEHDMPKPNSGLSNAWKEVLKIQRKQKSDPGFFFDQFKRK